MLKEIRQQPEHVRTIMMWLSVFITVSIVGYFWMKSLNREVYALLNPAQEDQNQTHFAQKNTSSPLSGIKGSWQDLKALISDLVNGLSSTKTKADSSVKNLDDQDSTGAQNTLNKLLNSKTKRPLLPLND